jgi:hypothetical protein
LGSIRDAQIVRTSKRYAVMVVGGIGGALVVSGVVFLVGNIGLSTS